MDARTLVGMTQGARKRAARDYFMRWDYEMSMSSRAYVLALFSPCDAATAEYKRLRGLVRIGQRIRPCPGKHGCVNCTLTCGACEDQIPDDTRCLQCGVVMTTEGPVCDGSGVVPARSRKVRQ